MIPACCPEKWEHVGVIACAVSMLDVGGIGPLGPETHSLGGFKKPIFAVRCPIRANYVAHRSPSPKLIQVSNKFSSTGRFSRQIRRPMSSTPSYSQLNFLGFQNPPHSRGASKPWTCGTRTPAPPIRSIISALCFFYLRRCPFHAP
jgi:hypothetical protein